MKILVNNLPEMACECPFWKVEGLVYGNDCNNSESCNLDEVRRVFSMGLRECKLLKEY